MYLERETSGATLAENWCAKNKKPLTVQGLHVFGAGNQVRTGDLYLGKVPLYQLSYSRFVELEGVLPYAFLHQYLVCWQPDRMASPRGVEPLLPG